MKKIFLLFLFLTSAIIYAQTGNIGIGTTTPAARLDIAGTGASNLATSEGDIRLGDATYRLKMGVANAGGSAGDAYIASSHRLYLGAGNNLGRTQTMSINSNGSVGIGTSFPGARLQVIGDTIRATVLSVTGSYTGLADVRGILSVSKPADGYGYGIEATGGFRGGYFFGNGGTYTGSVIGVYGIATGTAGSHYGIYGSAAGGTAENNWGGYFPTKTYVSELRVGGITAADGYVAAINGKAIATEIKLALVSNWPSGTGTTITPTAITVPGTVTANDLIANGNVGIGTTTPYSQLSNTTGNTIGSDASGGNPGSFSWAAVQSGYAAQFFNGGSTQTAMGW